jgi:hypothetical protein
MPMPAEVRPFDFALRASLTATDEIEELPQ